VVHRGVSRRAADLAYRQLGAWVLGVVFQGTGEERVADPSREQRGLADGFHVPGAGATNPFACAFLRHFVMADDSCREAAAAVMNQWLAARAARSEPSITLDEAVLASYAGEYRGDGKRTNTITREGTRLFIDIPKGDRSELFASPKGDFFFKVQTDTRVRFLREGETVTGLEFSFREGEPTIRETKIR
jgi:hypothetical protein